MMRKGKFRIALCVAVIICLAMPSLVFAGKKPLSGGEINEINTGFVSEKTKVVDLESLDKTMSKSEIVDAITSYKLTYKYTKKGSVNSSVKKYYEDMRNISGVPSSKALEYGLMSSHGELRQFPTDDWAKATSLNSTTDNFQECTLRLGEGVYIMHYSKDKKWAFVGTSYYQGWVKVSKIAKTSKAEMIDYVTADDFYMVITNSKGKLDNKTFTMTMGTKLKRTGSRIIEYPARNSKGEMYLKETKLSTAYKTKHGYLPATKANIVKQMKKWNGAPYGWGMDNMRQDCTSSIMSAYMTVGILIPRDTGCWVNIEGRKSLYGMSYSQKVKEINKLEPGDLVYYKGHGMMFTGVKDGKPVITHQTYPKAKIEVMPYNLISKTTHVYSVF